MPVPFFSGLGVFFKTRRYVAYLTIFVATTFLALYMTAMIGGSVGTPLETLLVNFFVYTGATGAIYFAIGSFLCTAKLDSLWITRRGRGRVTELKGIAWMAISFAIAVFVSVVLGHSALYFFAVFGWLGWIAFQAYLSARTSLRVATIAEPKKGGVAIGLGSLFILLIGLGLIGAEALAALWLIPQNVFGLGTLVSGIFATALGNLALYHDGLIIAYLMMGLFGLVSLLTFFRYARRGSALNVALLTLFIALYAGYFLVNVMRRQAPQLSLGDVAISVFFLVYAMSGIGRTVTESVEESRMRLRDLGPLLTFFLASGYFFVDSILMIAAVPGSTIASWFGSNPWVTNATATYLFKDIAKLTVFPLAGIFSSLFYLRVQRTERIIEKVREAGEQPEPGKVDKDIARRMPVPGESWPSETAQGIKEGKPGHDLSTPSPGRLSYDESKRLKPGKRLGEEEEEEEKK
ncbi:MAG: hypothetical protein C4K47_08780 [Candidatus Thorarchaeota archaeon]|nr:MAG: hypothetical protein C4K47_08780 [Candidatus Thorarchaeota archaeon]